MKRDSATTAAIAMNEILPRVDVLVVLVCSLSIRKAG
jgi:hypothetical protein